MNNKDKTIILPLGQALKDARLVASLSIEEVAEHLHLSVNTVREIEDDLDATIEDKKYPAIYLRGYLANYGKLVALDKIDQFIEYQNLLPAQKTSENIRSSIIIPTKVKKPFRWLWLFIAFIFVVTIYLLVTQVDYFSEDNSSYKKPAKEVVVQAKEKIVAVKKTEKAIVKKEPKVVAKVELKKPVKAVKKEKPIVVKEKELATIAPTVVEKKVAPVALEVDKPQVIKAKVALELLRLTFSADCWTEIFDATGKRLAFNLYKGGALLTVSGVPPFQLKLGDPGVVAIQYQGKPVESGFKAGQTARFSIPQ